MPSCTILSYFPSAKIPPFPNFATAIERGKCQVQQSPQVGIPKRSIAFFMFQWLLCNKVSTHCFYSRLPLLLFPCICHSFRALFQFSFLIGGAGSHHGIDVYFRQNYCVVVCDDERSTVFLQFAVMIFATATY